MEEVVCIVLDVGYCVFDMVYFYGNEKVLGSVLKYLNVERDELFIIFKFWNDY